MSIDEELRELNRRAEEMENNPMVCKTLTIWNIWFLFDKR